MRITPLIVGICLLAAGLLTQPAWAQTEYDWTIRTREQRFRQDMDKARTTQRAETHVRVRIDQLDEHTLEVRLESLRMAVLDTPAGRLEFDSEAEPDPEGILEPGLRPLIGKSFTVRYDPETGLIETEGELIELRASKAVMALTVAPWSTQSFMPFFVQTDDETGDQPRFRVEPTASGKGEEAAIADPIELTYHMEVQGVSEAMVLSFDELIENWSQGPLAEKENTAYQLKGSGQALFDPDDSSLRSYSCAGTRTLSLDLEEGKPVRSVVKVSCEVTRVAGAETPEPEEEEIVSP